MSQHVTLTFSLKDLVNFAKSSTLCNVVRLMTSNDVPLLVSYTFAQARIKVLPSAQNRRRVRMPTEGSFHIYLHIVSSVISPLSTVAIMLVTCTHIDYGSFQVIAQCLVSTPLRMRDT
ncbi:hypothetical protein FIBSPDRAFT_1052559 [Athelia psychrophila]|uniref:Proliferating cell nuclear antigen PCNA C-terminal domain-containing protein n=1 Tax=Athelia psychrophila TaxID=1759441 RepID=A0A165X3H2_9AGAM|nr:hypothetical protein FIBSPDRAFT_1054282 [Fibularhizoctonia sp. CBS 109695]KZP08158.1 hypothetical protein FIBSPDRAFT_1052559 [Fibularhizoctonia sp. CBS 109695]